MKVTINDKENTEQKLCENAEEINKLFSQGWKATGFEIAHTLTSPRTVLRMTRKSPASEKPFPKLVKHKSQGLLALAIYTQDVYKVKVIFLHDGEWTTYSIEDFPEYFEDFHGSITLEND